MDGDKKSRRQRRCGVAGEIGGGDMGAGSESRSANDNKHAETPTSPFTKSDPSRFDGVLIGGRGSGRFSFSDRGWFGMSWFGTIAMISLGMALQAGIGALLLREAGVTDVRSLNEFLQQPNIFSVNEFLTNTVLPQVESGLAMFNGSIRGIGGDGADSRPGMRLAREGARSKYPVVIVPGFVTSGLELWGGEECAQKHFRTRLWGSLSMAQTFFTDRECWRRHLSLDPFTGSDPPYVRLRAAQGFEAADYFMSTYWVWGKFIENLADVGYDGSNMAMMSYDWRLAFPILEQRDGYLTRLRFTIEAFHETTGEKAVIMSHSMGGSLVLYFFKWVTTEKKHGGGGGGSDWVEKYVHSFVNIAGTLLGVPKTVPALLSGELKDTAALLGALGSMMEQYFGRKMRKDMWSTWGSLWQMLPKGGDAIWGTGADICSGDDHREGLMCEKDSTDESSGAAVRNDKSGNMVIPKGVNNMMAPKVPLIAMLNDAFILNGTDNMPVGKIRNGSNATISTSNGLIPEISLPATCSSAKAEQKLQHLVSTSGWSTEETIDFLLQWGGGHGSQLSASKQFSFKSGTGAKLRKQQWHNPTATPLPFAPSLKIYCLYGIGLPTERAYFYKAAGNNACNGTDSNVTECSESIPNFHDPPIILDTSINDVENNVTFGVRFSDGDASVPLLSLGYMCANGWKGRNSFNPSGIDVVTREYQHVFAFQTNDPIRGGPRSADHVDILGNIDVMEDALRVVTSFDPLLVETRILSDIEKMASRINSHPEGGLKGARRKRRFWFQK